MGRLINLRHLNIKHTDDLMYLPEGIGKLSSLQCLYKFTVGGASGAAHIQELKDLNLLQGYLIIGGLGRVEVANEACGAELKEKQSLHALDLDFEPKESEIIERNQGQLLSSALERMEGVLQGLQPHRNLKELYIRNYPGIKFPSWMMEELLLYHLNRLELHDCINCTELPALGKLLSLEVLKTYRLHKLNKIGIEFYGFGTGSGRVNREASFPKLKELHIKDMDSLEEWDFVLVGGEEVIMPCLREIHLDCKNLKALPALGKLPSLELLRVFNMHQVKHIGVDFYGFGGPGNRIIAFPRLETLQFSGMHNLQLWDTGVEELEGKLIIMPCLRHLFIENIVKLKVLPAFGKLPSLEVLDIRDAREIEHLGSEFNGIGGVGGVNISFPKLARLRLSSMYKLEEWDLGVEDENNGKEIIIMPCIRQIHLEGGKLRTLSSLGKLPCLEELEIGELDEVKHIGPEFYGVNGAKIAVFPRLKKLILYEMENLEEWELEVAEGQEIMPRLSSIKFTDCRKLKVLRSHFPHTLKKLKFSYCPELTWRPPTYSPAASNSLSHPLIEKLKLCRDAGVFSRSLLFLPNIKYLYIVDPPETATFLQGLSELKELQRLRLEGCNSLVCMPEEEDPIAFLMYSGKGRAQQSMQSIPRTIHHPKLGIMHHACEVTHIAIIPEFYGVNSYAGVKVAVFPELKKLNLFDMKNLEEWELGTAEGQQIMPCLCSIELRRCPNVKALPHHLPQTLREIHISNCPNLTWRPTTSPSNCLSCPLIEKLELFEDAGVFSRLLSLIPTQPQVFGYIISTKNSNISPWLIRTQRAPKFNTPLSLRQSSQSIPPPS
ncbi:hypothetical protein BVC80_1791g17 [Macleaya cordata]|uniref:R13L1/DRL21-like LRR repeat region domain-containing protein n=1 Tax=Macleaya cordata TaxID=56857 RepID=A0A200QPR1_MACCD|nr:hypothetical protein BVC80_1791g17 [Macleaya cordata]